MITKIVTASVLLANSFIGGTVYDSIYDLNNPPASSQSWVLTGNALTGGEVLGSTTNLNLDIIRNGLVNTSFVVDGLEFHQPFLRRDVNNSSLTINGGASTLGAYTTWFGSLSAAPIVMRNKAVKYEFRDGSDLTWFSIENGGTFGDVVLMAPGGAAANFFRVIPQNLLSGAEMRGGTGSASAMRVYGNSHASFPRNVHLLGDFVRVRNTTDTGDSIVIDSSSVLFNPFGASAGQTRPLKFAELAANGTNSVAFKGPDSIASDVTWTLPSADASGFFRSNGSGVITIDSGSGTFWGLFGNSLVGGEYIGSNNAIDWDIVRNGLTIARVAFDGFQMRQAATISRDTQSDVLTMQGGATGTASQWRLYGVIHATFPAYIRGKADVYEFRDNADLNNLARLDSTVFTAIVPYSSPQGGTGERYGASSSVGGSGVAVGNSTIATGGGSTVVGFGSSSNGNADNTIIGKGIAVSGSGADKTLIGNDITIGNGIGTVAVGSGQVISSTSAGCPNCIVIGNSAVLDTGATASSSTVQIGVFSSMGTQVSVVTGVAIGSFASVGHIAGQGGTGAIAIGPSAESSMSRGIAFGRNAVASGAAGAAEGGAIGYGATTSHTNGWAIGRNAASIASSTLTFGSPSDTLSVVSYNDLAVSDGTTKTFRALPGQLLMSLPSAIPGDTYHVKWFERPTNGTDFFGIRATDNMTASFTAIMPPAGPTDDGEVMSFTASGVGSFVGPLWSMEGNNATAPDNLLGTTNAVDFSVIRNSTTIFNVTANGIQMNVTRIRTTGDDTSFILDGGDSATANARITLNGSLNASPSTIFYRASSHLFRDASDVEQARINSSGIALGTTSFGSGSYVVAIKGTVTTPSAVAGQGIIYVTSSGALRYRGPTTDTLLANP